MRIYQVNTPDGPRFVEAKTPAAAINFLVKSSYTAAPVSASELAAWYDKGFKVERAPVEVKAAA